MKNLKNISLGILISGSFALQAGLPESTFSSATDKMTIVSNLRNTNSIFALKKKKQVFEAQNFSSLQQTSMNSEYITGITKKEESKVAELLHWDFKVKFKLNKNMNIIFSYN